MWAKGLKRTARPWVGVGLALVATVASAHSEGGAHAHGWIGGLGHPFTGVDHWLAMLAVGVWADQLARSRDRRSRVFVPAAFVVCMALGAAIAWQGVGLPRVESGIAVSVLVLGLLIAARANAPLWMAASLAGCFALFHGYAHGAEAAGVSLVFVGGMMLATAVLHLLGMALGQALHAWRADSPWPRRALGASVAVSGLSLLALA